jgi:hypothetical protein
LTISTRRIGVLIWVLIYGGLFALGIGFAFRPDADSLAWSAIVGGTVAIAAGCLLIWIRSRMPTP